MDPYPTSAARAVASCHDALARLREEKAELINAVLAIKTNERRFWQRALAQDHARILHTTTAIESATEERDTASKVSLQQTLNEAMRAITKYKRRLHRAAASEAELRKMLEVCRHEMSRTQTPIPEEPHENMDDLTRIVGGLCIKEDKHVAFD